MSDEGKIPLNEMKETGDDSEEEDEDYVPTTNQSDDEGDGNGAANQAALAAASQSSIPTLSHTKERRVDDAFADLFGRPYVAPKSRNNSASTKKKPTSKKAMKKKKRILSEIFGGSSLASKLMDSSADVVANDLAIRRQRKGTLKQVVKREVKEMKKFAGQMVEVSRSVVGTDGKNPAPSAAGNNQAQPDKPAGIDAVLSQIDGPQKITTIDKTNMDWDSFKDKTGLEEELKKKAEGKDAYLVKKDFLNRVDARRFEQEKAERERKRSAAAASSI